MATYPSNVVVFSTHVNLIEIIDAAHPNNIQSEIVAIENTLGANPHISTTPSSAGTFTGTSTVYSTLTARLANIETGVVSDAHPHYLHKAGGDTVQSSGTGVIGVTFQAITGQSADFLAFKNVGGTTIARWDVSGNITAGTGTFSGGITSVGQTVLTISHSLSTSNTHGVGSNIVGVSDAQTLSNKTLSAPTITGVTTGPSWSVDGSGNITGSNLTNGILNCTSATRPGSPRTGQYIFETDTKDQRIWDGANWVRVASAQTGSWTLSVSTGGVVWTPSAHSEFYVIAGGVCHAWAYNSGPNPGSGSGAWSISWSGLPGIHTSLPSSSGGTTNVVVGDWDAMGRGSGDVRRSGTASADLIQQGNAFSTAWTNGPGLSVYLAFPVSA